MASDVIGRADAPSKTETTGSSPPGRVDSFFAAVERLPGPPELFYAVFGIGLAAVAQGILWASQYRVGVLELEVIQAPIVAVALLGLTHLLIGVARSAFEDFRPALGDSPDIDRYRRELTSIPDRVALMAIASGVVFVVGGFFVFVKPYIAPRPPIVDALTAPLWFLAGAVAGIFVVHDIRQLRAVSRMSRTAPAIDIFNTTSTNAFSRLTSVSSVTILLLVAAAVLSESEEIPIAYVVMFGTLVAVALATFVLPLRAMHDRLETEKKRLMASSNDRLKAVLGEVDVAVKQRNFSRAEQLEKMLNAVLAERDVLARLHTWPWSDTTFRGFASALLLPIVIFVITRTIEQLF